MNKRIIALLAASVFATGAIAAGQTDTGSYDKQFNKLDKNRDGMISKEEAGKKLSKDWSKADANSDGNIDKSEFSAFESAKSTKSKSDSKPAGGVE